MPCDLGFKSYSRIDVPVQQPAVLKKRCAAPAVDAELMRLIGQDDQQFVEWINELDTAPLLQKALDAALSAGGARGVTFSVSADGLIAETTYLGAREKQRAEKAIEKVSRRWQIEVLAVAAQLLDFETQVTATAVGGKDVLMLEGEKHGSSRVHEYWRVSFDPAAETTMLFEHFASRQEVDAVRDKFLALSQRLGVRIAVTATRQSGSPIPEGAVHEHFIRQHGPRSR